MSGMYRSVVNWSVGVGALSVGVVNVWSSGCISSANIQSNNSRI